MGIFDEVRVDATRLMVAWDQLSFENSRAGDYHRAGDFWNRFEQLLTARRDAYRQYRDELQGTQWQTEGAQAFLNRVNAGVVSMDAWLDATPANIATMFHEAADTIGPTFQTVNGIRDLLSGNGSVWELAGASAGSETPPMFRMEGNTVVAPPGYGPWVEQKITEAETAAKEVIGTFDRLKRSMALLPNPQWAGPERAMAPATGPTGAAPRSGPGGPGGGPSPGGPGGGPPAGGPEAPAGGPGAPAGGPEAPAGGPEAPAGGPGGPAGPGSETPTTPESTPDTSIGEPGLDPTATDQFGGPDSTLDPSTQLPPTDPALAGTPTATLDPAPTTTSLPSSTVPSGLNPTGSDLSRGPGAVPFAPTAATPFQSTRQNGVDAVPRSSTVDGSRPGAPTGGGNQGAGPSPVPRGGPAGAGPGTTGPGFFPPVVPPYGAGGQGGAGGGIRPGEAEFAGGPIRKAGGRDSWRAGLRPQLLGRGAAEHDDEPYEAPPAPPASGDVLDDELWQVPGAAPATPPEPPQRRGRSWG